MIEVPSVQLQERIVKVPKIQKSIVDTVVQNQVRTVEVERPTVVRKTVQHMRPIIQERITQVTRVVEEVINTCGTRTAPRRFPASGSTLLIETGVIAQWGNV